MKSQIICGIDGSKASLAAAQFAAVLARRLSMRLELLHVSGSADEATQLTRAQALKAQLGGDLSPGIVLHLQTGSPAEQLIAASRGAALLVIGTRGEGALRQALGGSVSAAVTRSAAAPVIVVPPRAAAASRAGLGGGGVICAIRDDHDVACAGTAACWAREIGVPLTLAHVVAATRMPVAPAGGVPPPGLAYSAADRAELALDMLEEIRDAIAPGAPRVCRTVVVCGAIGPQLDRLAATEDATVVAVGPHRHGPLASALTGSPAAHLLRRGTRPVMVCPSPESVLA